LAGSFGLGGP